jgi:hypothetical protein
MVKNRQGVTIAEMLIGMAILLSIVSLSWGFVRQVGRTAKAVDAVHAAVVHAELAMGALAGDVRSMMPPDPVRGTAPYRVAEDGRSLALMRVDEVRGGLRAKPVVYEARATPAGNFHLYRDGQRMHGVLLSEFKVEEHRLGGPAPAAGQSRVLPRALAINPRLRVIVEGVASDSPRDKLDAASVHRLAQIFAVPETSPASTVGLPVIARDLARRSVRTDGELAGP